VKGKRKKNRRKGTLSEKTSQRRREEGKEGEKPPSLPSLPKEGKEDGRGEGGKKKKKRRRAGSGYTSIAEKKEEEGRGGGVPETNQRPFPCQEEKRKKRENGLERGGSPGIVSPLYVLGI